MKGFRIFEELRYIIEVLIAEHMLFLWSPVKKKKGFCYLLPIQIALFIGLSLTFFPFAQGVEFLNRNYPMVLFGPFDWTWQRLYQLWYMALFALTILSLKLLYDASWSCILSRSVLAWCIQHIEYCLCNELIGIGFWNGKREQYLVVYILISVFSCALLYFIFYRLIRKYIRIPKIDDYPSRYAVFAYIIVLLVLTMFSFFCQGVFYWDHDGTYRYNAIVFDALICIMFIIMHVLTMRLSKISTEKKQSEIIFAERERQFLQNKQSIDIINHKVHDLKYQIAALKDLDSEEQAKAFQDVYRSISIYDSTFHTGNEIIDTILTQKKLLCEKSGIVLTAVIDGKLLSFMDRLDLLVLFGNLLDNAIEAVEKLSDNKIVSITLVQERGMVSLQTNNYYDGIIKMSDQTIVTSKNDANYHGYGLSSIREIVSRYHGNTLIRTDDHIFTVGILLPKS